MHTMSKFEKNELFARSFLLFHILQEAFVYGKALNYMELIFTFIWHTHTHVQKIVSLQMWYIKNYLTESREVNCLKSRQQLLQSIYQHTHTHISCLPCLYRNMCVWQIRVNFPSEKQYTTDNNIPHFII